ncbi:MAG: cysteine desulfurase family protein [Bacteroidota bacterium]
MVQKPIYLDHNATTPIASSVFDAMLPYLKHQYANPSSKHILGYESQKGVEKARQQLADLLQVDTDEIFFTSGATEAINFVAHNTKHALTYYNAAEHKAVLEAMWGIRHRIPIDSNGYLELDHQLMTADHSRFSDISNCLVIILANNETGVIQPIRSLIKDLPKDNFIIFSDATQAVGKIPVYPRQLGVDVMAMSAHKFYGPKGVGALYIRKDLQENMSPLLYGGGQEQGLRAGTLNVPGIVGMGAAAKLAKATMRDNALIVGMMRDAFEAEMMEVGGICINGTTANRLYNTSNLRIEGILADDLLQLCGRQICFSTGSACSSDSNKPSHVLRAMGLSAKEAWSSARFSFGVENTMEEVTKAAGMLKVAIEKLRNSV